MVAGLLSVLEMHTGVVSIESSSAGTLPRRPFFAEVQGCRIRVESPLPAELERIPLPAALHSAVPKRQAEFRAGRSCAMTALAELDPRFAGFEVGRGDSGAPVWPGGIVGSISHSDGVAAAVVATTAVAAGLGIDTERVMSESQARSVGRIVAWPSEMAHGRAAGLTRLEALTLVFSAKESIFKCLHPLVGSYFDFHDVRIEGVDVGSGMFVARIVRKLADVVPAQTVLEGRFDLEASSIHTGVALQPRMVFA